MKNKNYRISLRGLAAMSAIESGTVQKVGDADDMSTFDVFWETFEKKVSAEVAFQKSTEKNAEETDKNLDDETNRVTPIPAILFSVRKLLRAAFFLSIGVMLAALMLKL